MTSILEKNAQAHYPRLQRFFIATGWLFLYHDNRQASVLFMLARFLILLKNKWLWIGLGLAVIVGFVAWWPVSQPSIANFALQPEHRHVTKGQQFSVSLSVTSTKPANAVDAILQYPADALQVVSTSSKKSRFDMILFPAKANQTNGTVRYIQATAIPFHGFSQGLVGIVTFKAVKNANVSFKVSGKIVANDSKGTDLTTKQPDKQRWQVWFGQ